MSVLLFQSGIPERIPSNLLLYLSVNLFCLVGLFHLSNDVLFCRPSSSLGRPRRMKQLGPTRA